MTAAYLDSVWKSGSRARGPGVDLIRGLLPQWDFQEGHEERPWQTQISPCS
ncbi:hypothetical protein DB31_7546 [Hyalangium minutum]|uniref:Uncharacterized protein n=1 Tax=Hyalangium minutum TaxID=394096 RepID=A0A085WKU6_9BACT|nr:hypothetical protein DB31_7546 [Hyalangium minutum]